MSPIEIGTATLSLISNVLVWTAVARYVLRVEPNYLYLWALMAVLSLVGSMNPVGAGGDFRQAKSLICTVLILVEYRHLLAARKVG